jgi:hypothetical protein
MGPIVAWRSLRSQATVAKHRIVTSLKRRDEHNEIYDLTRTFLGEATRHPFAAHDDLLDATARIFDINPMPPVVYESSQTTESLEMIDSEDAALVLGTTPV